MTAPTILIGALEETKVDKMKKKKKRLIRCIPNFWNSHWEPTMTIVPPSQSGTNPAAAAAVNQSFVTLDKLFHFSESHRLICKNSVK